MGRVLIVEDTAALSSVLAEYLREDLGAAVTVASSLIQARVAITNSSFDLVFLDLYFDGGTAFDFLEILREEAQHRRTPVILMTGLEAPTLTSGRSAYARDLGQRIRRLDVQAHLTKPFSLDEVRTLTQRLARPSSSYDNVS